MIWKPVDIVIRIRGFKGSRVQAMVSHWNPRILDPSNPFDPYDMSSFMGCYPAMYVEYASFAIVAATTTKKNTRTNPVPFWITKREPV